MTLNINTLNLGKKLSSSGRQVIGTTFTICVITF